ncbi:hypothetical protein GCM10011320_31340 [Neoroseomonas lacus]|uniref:NrS-1 polymerase-like helicase domain-containing protein n=1 Tax=Neoroseomonas lacus TaxID=287609 RepID=A0A917KNE6_9PROT|nr:hypothetical protein GCM10011320_31340 [Neoroseomonas lacus]
MHLADAQDAAPGDAAGGAGGDAGGRDDGVKVAFHLDQLPSVRAYLDRIGARMKSFRNAVVSEPDGKGYFRDVAYITFNRNGEVKAPEPLAPTEAEASVLAQELASAPWPELQPVYGLRGDAPVAMEIARREGRLFEFREAAHQVPQGIAKPRIIMFQERARAEDEGWKYRAWTFWSDQQWRIAEPDGLLPLWGMEQLADNSTVFLHEGAKAARAVREMIEAKTPAMMEKLAEHPWARDLQHAAHLGWVGGAPNPQRTDWSVLKKAGIKFVYVVADCDPLGQAAVEEISKHLAGVAVIHVKFASGDWPPAFDLAEDFPATMFKSVKGKQPGEGDRRIYIGPKFSQLLEPATWATEMIMTGARGRPKFVLRKEFAQQWVYVRNLRRFVYRANTTINYDADTANGALRKFSEVENVAALMMKRCEGVATMTYSPNRAPSDVISMDNGTAINTFRHSRHYEEGVKRLRSGGAPLDASMWLGFLEYLITTEHDRRQVARWCATLIARPDIRMAYAMLLISVKPGTGKTTLAMHILDPLVGSHNVTVPNANQITANFNPWVANGRLAIINEVYHGHNWTTQNGLKSTITESTATVNEKFEKEYKVENWIHIIASSNAMRALRLDDDDRRWLAPEVTETPWSLAKFRALREWLACDGLAAIMDWALRFGDGKAEGEGYVQPGAHAPMTTRKMEVTRAGRPDEVKDVVNLVEFVERDRKGKPFALSSRIARDHFQMQRGEGATLGSHLRYEEFDGGLGDVGLKSAGDLDPRLGGVKFGSIVHRPRLDASAMEVLAALEPSEVYVEMHGVDALLAERRDLIRSWLREGPGLLAAAQEAAKKEVGGRPM